MIQRDLTHIVPALTESSEFHQFKKQVVYDYWLAVVSRECSVIGRKEVLTGKAKFGIVGDGKEVAQIAMAKAFEKGDWRSGYYRDQTLVMALGICSVKDFFAQLYADVENDPFSGGRQMNSHFATASIDAKGQWLNTMDQYNSSSDISCTGGQMARGLGLALASTLYKKLNVKDASLFTDGGNEVSFVTIGDASTSEGAFWETMNAAAVMSVPLVVAVWDDGYGISVPVELQTVKASISKAMEGFLIDDTGEGIYIYTAKAWDYAELCSVFEAATKLARKNHKPALVHITDVTQPQGHSTSGSHERYKSKTRLEWEKEYDCIGKMGEWMVGNAIITLEELDQLTNDAKEYARAEKNEAWNQYSQPIKEMQKELVGILQKIDQAGLSSFIVKEKEEMAASVNPVFSEVVHLARKMNHRLQAAGHTVAELGNFVNKYNGEGIARYQSHLYAEGEKSALNVAEVKAQFNADSEEIPGYQILNRFFDQAFAKNEHLIAFGEDVGKIGDVNQGFAGLQDKYGENRIFDAGIREWTIIGQAIGTAMRGFRPIAEIQYLDYLTYAFSPLTDDLATLRYRSNGIQKAPAIIRSRGHRLEGIWHAGSPMGMLINSLKGMYLCVPRNMTQAAGMYNTLLQADDPALVVESLNGYRLKEKVPANLDGFTVPLGRPEILVEGSDITLVSYGSCLREVLRADELIKSYGISAEIIDLQTLMPFDLEGIILASLKKTNRIVFIDEDVPGGATAFMLNEVINVQGGYRYLDAQPLCLTAKPHRTPFGSDGDYFTKPFAEDVVDIVLEAIKA
ncbi:MAG: thiamine pyrophosphate-dependent enzyme [Saprospiraceae bacterium]